MEECIVRTLAYFDIFDYPLTFSEIKKYLGCKNDMSDEELYEILDDMSLVQESEGYFYLLGRSKLASLRSERYAISLEKHAKARVITRILSFIPTIEYIGINGSLSMNNSSNSDDIDLFFITKKNTLWITRFAVNSILSLLRQRKTRRVVKDKISPNILLSADKLTLPKNKRTLYGAHEIVQVNSVYDKGNFKDLLIHKNGWVKDFFPNLPATHRKKNQKTSSLWLNILKPIEKVFYFVQKMYMGKNRTNVKITMNFAFLHSEGKQKIIMDLYMLRSKRYLELLSDNFWVDSDEARFYMDDKKIRILN